MAAHFSNFQQAWFFRTDGNSTIGLGHVMRCLSIADVATERGIKCYFVLSDSNCESIIHDRGYQTIITQKDYRDFSSEAEGLKKIITVRQGKYFLIDTYYATYDYLVNLFHYFQSAQITMICMDGNKPFPYPCDFLINYNIYSHRRLEELKTIYGNAGEKTNKLPLFLFGTGFVPLRKEFWTIERKSINRECKKVFVSTGGADSEHLTLSLLDSLERKDTTLEYHFVVGAMNRDIIAIEERSRQIDNVYIHKNVKNMCELMAGSDMAISAAGSTLYELCATQTPTITYVLAENQTLGALEFSKMGLMENAGDVRCLGVNRLSNSLIEAAQSLAWDYARRAIMSDLMRKTINPRGVYNIVDTVIEWKSDE